MSLTKLAVAQDVAELLGMDEMRACESVYYALEALSLAGMLVDVEKAAHVTTKAPSSIDLTTQILKDKYSK